MKLSIIVCVFNEIKTIKKILLKIDKVNLPFSYLKEVIIVDNNSTDGTKEYLKELKLPKNYKIFFQNKNYGKGNSVIKGIKAATGDLTIFQDADLEYDPQNYIKLINYLKKNQLDAVFGSRIKNTEDFFYYRINRLAVIYLTKLINYLFKGSFTDAATNHKLIKTNILRKLKIKTKGFESDFEITLKLLKYKFKCDEIAIKYFPRKHEAGKKIKFQDGIKSLMIIIYFYLKFLTKKLTKY
ncbi:glycosyltransferase family 2 protein [Candidatus Pelagibacter sp. HIMB1593]|uniref:glycosyltransferase family 2 protein n=1 Tax=Candidatus Pelagibacter sp. HIMB1593 TaxID=3413355 RepID=UPI003F82DFDE